MCEHQTPEAHAAPDISSSINSIIAAANKHDRYKLLEDDSLPAADLNNPIHPAFKWFDCNGPMRQALLLASQFLAHDSLLTFFAHLIYGRELTATDGGKHKVYLSDPLNNASDARRQELINGAREALHCLAHSVRFDWMNHGKRVYARTMTDSFKPVHEAYCNAFQKRVTTKIELNERFGQFYTDKDGYTASSRCAQFRHDFHFAMTIVHELVHAVGIMRRGHTKEEWIRTDYPDTEWGYVWENFMFGYILNPQDRDRHGTYLLMKKVWAVPALANKHGGKQYSDVPMSWIAQWFRQETWDIIAKHGPSAIPPPETHFKIQSNHKFCIWVVSTDNLDMKPDIVALGRRWRHEKQILEACGLPVRSTDKIHWRPQTKGNVRKHNVPIPLRFSRRNQQYPMGSQTSRVSKVTRATVTKKIVKSTTVKHTTPTSGSGKSRKRHTEEDTESVRPAKTVKR